MRAMKIFTLLLAFCVAPAASADVLDDFREAAAHTGCESLPYPDARRNCKANSEQVEKNCKHNTISCDTLLVQKKKLRTSVERAQLEVDKLISKREGVQKKLDKTKVDGEIRKYGKELASVDDAIASQRTIVADLQREFDEFDVRSGVAVGVQMAKWCVTSRQVVQQVFDLNSDRILDQTLGSKATAAEKAELQSLAASIIEKMKPQWKIHKDEIENNVRRVANCQKVIDLR